MSQSLTNVLVHLVFSTKKRQPLLDDFIREGLHSYIAGIVASLGGILLKAGSVPDHIHLLLVHPRRYSSSELVGQVKTGSSRWLKARDSRYDKFQWQRGYGIFSISPTHRIAVEKYLANQANHHRLVTFQEEYRRLLDKYGIAFEEKYLWD